jgi:SET domain-containing protein|tara:strand:+ start:4402 stop:4680 length:279 start_codon:yes stop_codon:yes gene_type:complete
MYKPLKEFLTIKKSKIHGLGVFTTEPIKAGIILGETHYYTINLIRTPLGGFLNHSNKPNCYIVSKDDIGTLHTVRLIKKNEELTVYYRLYDV